MAAVAAHFGIEPGVKMRATLFMMLCLNLMHGHDALRKLTDD